MAAGTAVDVERVPVGGVRRPLWPLERPPVSRQEAGEVSSVAGGERQGGGRRQQVGAALDLGGPGAGQVALGREQIEDAGQSRRAIRLQGRLVCLLRRRQQGQRVLVLPEGRLHVGIGFPHFPDRPQLERGEVGVSRAAQGRRLAQGVLALEAVEELPLEPEEGRATALDVGYCRVSAPFDAYVTNLNIAVGEYARQGQQVFALVDDRAWYVLANFRETYMPSIKPGMEAEVYLVTSPGRPFRGVVQGIGWANRPDDGATVGVLPEVRRTLNWVRLANRFQVRVRLEERDADRPFRMGTTAVVTIRGFPRGTSATPSPR